MEILTTLFNIFVNQLNCLIIVSRALVSGWQRGARLAAHQANCGRHQEAENTKHQQRQRLYRPGPSVYNWEQCSAVQSIHGRGPEVGGVSNIHDKGPHRGLFYYSLLVISLKYNNDPVSRCRDAGEKGSRKETIGYGAGGAVSDIGGV